MMIYPLRGQMSFTVNVVLLMMYYCCFFTTGILNVRDKEVIAQLSIGKIQGKSVETEKKNVANVFLGVPYGEPPINDLRFSAPKPKSSWTGILNCTEFGPACMQNKRPQVETGQESYVSEDCLIQNVIVLPSLCSHSHPCPVISVIHGGAWYFDSPNHLPLNELIDRWASHGLVIVAPGYRMGAFGFWNTGTQDAMGNYVLYGLQYHGPRIDGLLLPSPAEELAKNREPYPLMIGTTLYETGVPALATFLSNVTAANVTSACYFLVKFAGYRNPDTITQLCARKYTAGQDYAVAITKLMDDVTIFGPTYSDARSMRDAGAPVYLYSFDFVKRGLEGWSPFHALDVFYVLRLHWDIFGFQFDQRDEEITNLDLKLIVNFAKYGDPTPEDGSDDRWQPLNQYNYYKIDLPPGNQPLYHYNAVDFWCNVVPLVEETKYDLHFLLETNLELTATDNKDTVVVNKIDYATNWQVAFWITLAFSLLVLFSLLGLAGFHCMTGKRGNKKDFEHYLEQEERRALLS